MYLLIFGIYSELQKLGLHRGVPKMGPKLPKREFSDQTSIKYQTSNNTNLSAIKYVFIPYISKC